MASICEPINTESLNARATHFNLKSVHKLINLVACIITDVTTTK